MTLFHREAEGNSHLMRDRGGGNFLHSVKLLSLFMKNIATVNIRASNGSGISVAQSVAETRTSHTFRRLS